MDTLPIILKKHTQSVSAVVISQDNRWLVSASKDKTVRVFDLKDSNIIPLVLEPKKWAITTVAISSDNQWLATGTLENGDVFLWNLADLASLHHTKLPGHALGEKCSISIAISNNNRWLVLFNKERNIPHLWENWTESYRVCHDLKGHTQPIRAVAISPDNHWLVTASDDMTALLWDLTKLNPEKPFLALSGHDNQVCSVAFSADSRRLVTGCDDARARVWDLQAFNLSATLNTESWGIRALALSADNRWLATGGYDGTVCVWDFTASASLQESTRYPLRGHSPGENFNIVIISPDSRWLVTCNRGSLALLWDLKSDLSSTIPIVLRGHEGTIQVAAISSDSHWLVTSSDDGTARLWDLNVLDGDPLAIPIILRGHEGAVLSVAFSPDNHWLVTGGQDGKARLWNLWLDELIESAYQTVGRNLTWDEWDLYFPKQEYRRTCPNLPAHYSVIKAKFHDGIRKNAESAYKQAVAWVIETDDANLNSAIGRRGCLDGYAGIVMSACERAVSLMPDSVGCHDSRGLARALNNDYLGAIEDLRFYETVKNQRQIEEFIDRSQRQSWLEKLSKGENPFDKSTLHNLKQQGPDPNLDHESYGLRPLRLNGSNS
ncbi:MAG: WD40 repeat domain-containing protein [Candidatus Competibacteraceae bacterium]